MQCTIDYKLFVSTAWTSTACRQEKLRNKLLRSQIVWYLTIQVNIKFCHSPASLLPHAKIRPEIFIGQGWNRILTWSIIMIVFIYWAKIVQSFPLKFIVCTTLTGQYKYLWNTIQTVTFSPILLPEVPIYVHLSFHIIFLMFHYSINVCLHLCCQC